MTSVRSSAFLFICYLLTCSVKGAQRFSADVWVESALANRHNILHSPVELLDLDLNHDLDLVDTFTTVSGTLKVKYQQLYNNVPILGATVVLEQTEDGTFTSDAYGDFIKGTEHDITESKFPKGINRKLHPTGLNEITEAEALDISLKAFGVQKEAVDLKSSQQIVYLDDNDQAHLAYEITIEVTANDTLSIPAYVIDVYSRQVLDTWPKLYSMLSPVSTPGGNVNIGKYAYGKNGLPSLMAKYIGGRMCKLQSDDISVYNFKSGARLPNDVYSFSCYDGIQDEINGGYGPLADGFFLAQKTFEMHRVWYDMEAYEPKPLIVGVHFDRNLDNAYFFGSRVVFGDGYFYFYPLSSSNNIVGHEIAHGFTSRHSRLIYRYQSGGMNEAFSDMAGEALEYYLKGKVDWHLAMPTTKRGTGLRNYINPSKDGMSIGHVKDYNKNVNVHNSSGVYNKACYLLANKPGWNLQMVYHVLLIANKMYWPRDATFCKGMKGNLKAAKDLGFNVADVIDAFKMVGVTTNC